MSIPHQPAARTPSARSTRYRRTRSCRCSSGSKRTAVWFVCAAAFLLFSLPVSAQSEYRHQQNSFAFDPEIVETWRLEADLAFQTRPNSLPLPGPESDELVLTLLGATQVLEDFEVGFRLPYISRDYDSERLGSPSGTGDTFLWGKYRLTHGEGVTWSAGAFLTLPTGDDNAFMGTDSLGGGLFASVGIPIAFDGQVQAFAGFGFNDDLTYRRDGRLFRAEGTTSILTGFGVVFPTTAGLETFAQFRLETERYKNGDSAAEITGGGRWPLSGGWAVQAWGGIGIADAAPNLQLGIGVVLRPQ